MTGHNFQLAALFLRTKDWPFLSDEEAIRYQKLGLNILAATLDKNVFPDEGIANGFFRELNPITGGIIDTRKSWWQHCEAIIALSLSGEKFKKERDTLETFFFDNFWDHENGGEYFFISQENEPILSELKGNIGKSIYHTTEMIRFRMENP